MFRQVSLWGSMLRHTASEVTGEQRNQLDTLGISVVDGPPRSSQTTGS